MVPEVTRNNDTAPDDAISLARRQWLIGGGALLAAATTGTAMAASNDHKEHVHGAPKKYQALTATALDCLKTGQECLNHCLKTFKTGDTTLAECAARVQETLATCDMLSQLSSFESKHLNTFLAGCIAVCNDCADECRKHETKHPECKACGDSCVACVKEMKKLPAKA